MATDASVGPEICCFFEVTVGGVEGEYKYNPYLSI
jgi:hypothetical protein